MPVKVDNHSLICWHLSHSHSLSHTHSLSLTHTHTLSHRYMGFFPQPISYRFIRVDSKHWLCLGSVNGFCTFTGVSDVCFEFISVFRVSGFWFRVHLVAWMALCGDRGHNDWSWSTSTHHATTQRDTRQQMESLCADNDEIALCVDRRQSYFKAFHCLSHSSLFLLPEALLMSL